MNGEVVAVLAAIEHALTVGYLVGIGLAVVGAVVFAVTTINSIRR